MAKLHIVTCVSNPLGWKSRDRNAITAIRSWLEDENVHVTLVESCYGDQSHKFDWLANDRLTVVPVRNKTLVWHKESLLNIGIKSLPDNAEFIGTFDADVAFIGHNWAQRIIDALRANDVVQPWGHAYDLGPNYKTMAKHTSFMRLATTGLRPRQPFDGYWMHDGVAVHGHPGYAWAWRKDYLDKITDQQILFDRGALGSGDRHMAFGLTGHGHESLPHRMHDNYHELVELWGANAFKHQPRLGYVDLAINHLFHGYKPKREYKSRWHILIDHNFDPLFDVEHNAQGVLEFRGNKPELEAAVLRYFTARDEDERPEVVQLPIAAVA